MKRLHNYILLSVLAFVLASCSEDEVIDINGQGQVAGDISFGLSLPEVSSRTVYGKEAGKAFPIYWVDGDKVQVFSPQGLDGRKSAEYVVSTKDDKGNVVTDLNYASNLTKTGANGVQWGTSEYHDFYSLYPSGNYTLSTDGSKAENITISNMQNIEVKGGVVKSDMEDCLMYAKTTGVAKGAVVNLEYKPITTVLMVTVKVAANQTGTDPDNFTIQSIILEAKEKDKDGKEKDIDIVGTFNLDISNGSFGEFTANKANNIQVNIINSSTGGFHSIGNNESFEIPLFLAPIEGLNVSHWKISVVANNNTYTKTLNIDKTLTPGQIHKITLPELAPAAKEWEVSKWMTYIPRNVYLSEVSIPGSWNSINSDYQSNKTIDGQYAIGVRAFHFDTRWRTSDTSVSVIGNLGGNINGLSVAGGAESGKYNGGDRVVSGDANTFADYLKQITDNIVDESGNRKPEYMVVMCTFAQDSYNYTDADGKNWVDAISDACATNTYVYDAKNLTSNTVVGDVIGQVIVIVNMEGAVTTVPSGSKCLFVDMPLTLTSDLFGAELNDNNKGLIYKGSANTTAAASDIEMYHTQAQISIAGETYTDSHDRSNVMGRGFAPTFGERKTVANNILDWSKNNYGTENYQHNKWIYLGLGGYYSNWNNGPFGFGAGWEETKGSNATVASNFNTWINGKVTEMATIPEGATAKIPYYPVGIVLMNFTNDYSPIVKNILLLNNKYRLQYDQSKPTDYNPGQTTQNTSTVSKANYDSTVENGGNAISWD